MGCGEGVGWGAMSRAQGGGERGGKGGVRAVRGAWRGNRVTYTIVPRASGHNKAAWWLASPVPLHHRTCRLGRLCRVLALLVLALGVRVRVQEGHDEESVAAFDGLFEAFRVVHVRCSDLGAPVPGSLRLRALDVPDERADLESPLRRPNTRRALDDVRESAR